MMVASTTGEGARGRLKDDVNKPKRFGKLSKEEQMNQSSQQLSLDSDNSKYSTSF